MYIFNQGFVIFLFFVAITLGSFACGANNMVFAIVSAGLFTFSGLATIANVLRIDRPIENNQTKQ